MNKAVLKILVVVSLLSTSCAHYSDSVSETKVSARAIASVSADKSNIESAIKRMEHNCSLTKKVKDRLKEAHSDGLRYEAKYIRQNGSEIQTFLDRKDGRLIFVTLADKGRKGTCNIEHFALEGDSIVTTREASGQLYMLSEKGRPYVMIPDDSFASGYGIFQVLNQSGKEYGRGWSFNSLLVMTGSKAAGLQEGIGFYRGKDCTQDVVETKSVRERFASCVQPEVVIRGDITEERLAEIEQVEKQVVRNTPVDYVRVIVLPAPPRSCVQVKERVSFFFFFSYEETYTQCT